MLVEISEEIAVLNKILSDEVDKLRVAPASQREYFQPAVLAASQKLDELCARRYQLRQSTEQGA
jgi:hypothetical protein